MKYRGKTVLALMLVLVFLFTTACGGGSGKNEVPALGEVTQIPEDGVITREQFATVAGENKVIQFTGTSEAGIAYQWSFQAAQIQNPVDQNLKVEFTLEGLSELMKQVEGAVDALKMTFPGGGVIAVPDLSVTVPAIWSATEAKLYKIESGTLTEVTDAQVQADGEAGTTTVTVKINSLDGEYILIGTAASKDAEDAEKNTSVETTTAKKEETTTKKKAETTTAKKEETTTKKKAETTTAKKEETTTKKKEETTTAKKKPTCTISISCKTLLNNMDQLEKEKHNFVPSNGWILSKTKVTFEEGESVHDILKRVCKSKGIHMESSYTPMYDSAYVEGINQLYEFDGGPLSGWMYKVNGWFPNYGCSKYTLQDGDKIEWVYTCDLGADVGDNSMSFQGK